MALTLWGPNYDGYRLRRIAGELDNTLKQVPDVSETRTIGGLPRQVRVVLDTQKLAAYGLTPGMVVQRLQGANARSIAGSFARDNREFQVEAGRFFTNVSEIQQVVVGVHGGRPVYLKDISEKLEDGPAEADSYVLFGEAAGAKVKTAGLRPGTDFPAVTLTLAKRKGTNATIIANRVQEKINGLRGYLLPNDLHVTVTRNYGKTAEEKSNELLEHLLLATFSVTLLIGLALGWRESGVVLVAIPVTLALTLAIFYLYGYTLNRVTLFALIFSIGILVDDAIVVVENIVRHFRLPENRGRRAGRRGRGGGGRGGQSHHPGDLCRDLRHSSHGIRARADGALHASHPGGRLGSHAVLAGRGLHRFTLGGAAPAAPLCADRRQTPARGGRLDYRGCTAG